MESRKLKQGRETLDWDSYPQFGRWYYLVPFSILFVLVLIGIMIAASNYLFYFRCTVFGHDRWSYDLLDRILFADLLEFVGYSSFCYNFFLWIYYPFFRNKKRIVFKKDPVRIALKYISIINFFLIPGILYASSIRYGNDYSLDILDDIVLYFIVLLFTGWIFIIPLFSSVFDKAIIDLIVKDSGTSRSRSTAVNTSTKRPTPNRTKSSSSSKRTYIGSNGEFAQNDRERAYNEDILQFRSIDKNFDASEHFGWEHELNYDSDGYRDEE